MLVKITLPDGTQVEGDKDDVRGLLEAAGHIKRGVPYYYSSTRGLMEVSKMPTPHIKNALLKIYREWASALSMETDPQLICSKIISGPDNKDFSNLFYELKKRYDKA